MAFDSTSLMEATVALWKESIKPNINDALGLVPEDKMDWAPGENMLTFADTFLHIGRTSGWWYSEFMKGQKRELLPDDYGKSKQELAEQLEEHWARMELFFEEPDEIMQKLHEIEHEGKLYQISGYWVLVHMFEHDIHHRSQINQYFRVLGITPPKI